jgi:hypothetical protein
VKLLEAFGTGTAVSIQPISALGYQEKIFDLKINEEK